MRKKNLRLTIASTIFTFLCQCLLHPVQAVEVFEPEYSATAGAQLEAYVIDFADKIPPVPPQLQSPTNNSTITVPRPIFVFKEAIDEKKINKYILHLKSDDDRGEVISIEIEFGVQGKDDERFRAWYENGLYYVQLKSDLPEGKYKWYVTAFDKANGSDSSTWYFTYAVSYRAECAQSTTLANIRLSKPSSVTSSRLPAVVLEYPEGTQLQHLDLSVDYQPIFTGVSMTTHTTKSYAMRVEPTRAVFQPFSAYLPEKSESLTWKLTVSVTDNNNCQREFHLDPLTWDQAAPLSQALIPQLTSPTNNFASQSQIKSFSWRVCAAPDAISTQVFTLNNQPLYSLGHASQETDAYTLDVADIGPTACAAHTTQITLHLKKASIINYNYPDNHDDWHRWSVSVTDINGLEMTSPIWRFRYLPAVQGTYYWCTNTSQCTKGTFEQCLASGKNCYFGSASDCQAQASQDCSAHPPVQTYHWCTSAQQCAAGSLQECATQGKNCYLHQSDDQYGCLQHAAFECGDANYYWCSTGVSCDRGSFADCKASGQTCYRQVAADIDCPAACATSIAIVADNPYELTSPTPEDSFLPTFICWLVPFGLLIIIFPRPVGRVFDARTHRGVARALVVVTKNGRYINASLTNRFGFFTGFKLDPGEYQIIVSSRNYHFPSRTDHADQNSPRHYYQGGPIKIRHIFVPTLTCQIPVDFDPEPNISDAQREKLSQPSFVSRILQLLASFLNHLNFLWPLAFFLTLVFMCCYPSPLVTVVFCSYLIGFFRRLAASIHRHNLTGRLLDGDGRPLSRVPLILAQEISRRPVGQLLTDKRGYFDAYLNPDLVYLITSDGLTFVELEGNTPALRLDFAGEGHVNLQLVAIKT